jgi:hypothetical protein
MAVLGGMLAFFGVQEWRVSTGTTEEPIAVDLAEVESGQQPANAHWNLGEHVAVYTGGVYEVSQSKYDTGQPGPDAKVNYYYYPVMSVQHPFMQQLKSLAEKYGSTEAIPEEEAPPLNDFAVLVKTKQFKTLGAIPDSWDVVPNLEGLVINQISSLSGEEVQLFQESFPGLNTDKLLLLEADRHPASTAKSVGMISGGSIVALAGVAWMFAGRKS